MPLNTTTLLFSGSLSSEARTLLHEHLMAMGVWSVVIMRVGECTRQQRQGGEGDGDEDEREDVDKKKELQEGSIQANPTGPVVSAVQHCPKCWASAV